jgi:hypothetical protein
MIAMSYQASQKAKEIGESHRFDSNKPYNGRPDNDSKGKTKRSARKLPALPENQNKSPPLLVDENEEFVSCRLS